METLNDSFFMQLINHAHSILRWGVLITLFVSIYNAWDGNSKKRQFNTNDNKWNVWTIICTHTMLVLGLVQYFVGAWGLKNIKNLGMSTVMKDPVGRFFAVEHIAVMILAIILIQVGRSQSKRATIDAVKHKKVLVFFTIGLLLILSRIPWPFMQGFEGRGWF
jgi:putative Ca2+/H+ antiporter (TMEM165/GDT1 family)